MSVDHKEMFCKPGDERSLLSYALKRADDFYAVCSKVDETDFLSSDHRTIYVIMKTLVENGGLEKFDISMIVNEAKNNGVVDNIGGYDYIDSIRQMPLERENLNYYVKNVLEASTKYKIYKDLSNNMRVVEENRKDGKDSEDLLGMIEAKVMDLSTKTKAIIEPRDISVGIRDYIEEKRDNPVEMSGISTGYSILDTQIDGLVPGTLNIISARKKMGKSTFLTNVAANAAFRLKIPVLYIDTEMTFEEWRDRIIAMLSGVPERVVKHGGYTKDQYDAIIYKCVKIMERNKLFHERMPAYSVDKVSAIYKKYKIKENIGLAIFDYLKEPDGASINRQRKEWQILGDVSTRLKDLAGSLGIPFLSAVQLNRDNDVAGSDRISWFADVVMEWRERTKEELDVAPDDGGYMKLIVRDTRRGGRTPEEGISYIFKKASLLIKEALPHNQLIEYGKGIVKNHGSDDEKELR